MIRLSEPCRSLRWAKSPGMNHQVCQPATKGRKSTTTASLFRVKTEFLTRLNWTIPSEHFKQERRTLSASLISNIRIPLMAALVASVQKLMAERDDERQLQRPLRLTLSPAARCIRSAHRKTRFQWRTSKPVGKSHFVNLLVCTLILCTCICYCLHYCILRLHVVTNRFPWNDQMRK